MTQFIVNLQEKSVLVKLDDRIYIEDALSLQTDLTSYFNEGYTTFTFDMHNVVYLDASLLNTLAYLNNAVLSLHGKVAVSGLQGMPRELFTMTKFDSLLID